MYLNPRYLQPGGELMCQEPPRQIAAVSSAVSRSVPPVARREVRSPQSRTVWRKENNITASSRRPPASTQNTPAGYKGPGPRHGASKQSADSRYKQISAAQNTDH